jgi:hypothetical protein
MFIAVINENFDVAEEAKKGKQASNYWEEANRPTAGHITWLRRLNPYRWIRASPVEVKVEALPANLVLPMQKSLVQDYSVPRADAHARAMSEVRYVFFVCGNETNRACRTKRARRARDDPARATFRPRA